MPLVALTRTESFLNQSRPRPSRDFPEPESSGWVTAVVSKKELIRQSQGFQYQT